jgi:hypothetical protein
MSSPASSIFFHASNDLAFGVGGVARFLRFDPAAAASAGAKLAAGAAAGAVLTGAERRAWAISLAVKATALRFSGKLPVYVIDRQAGEIADAQNAIVDPTKGQSCVGLDPFGPILGTSDASSMRALQAVRGAIRSLGERTAAPGGNLPPFPVGFPMPPIDFSQGEQLGIAPAIGAALGAGLLVGLSMALIADRVLGDPEAVSRYESRTAIANHAADVAADAAIARHKLEHVQGRKIDPSPIEVSAGKAIEAAAATETKAGWMSFALGGAVIGVAGGGALYLARGGS